MPEKYEREIEEILRKTSFSAPQGKGPPANGPPRLTSEWQKFIATVSPTRLLVLGLVLALVGYVLREFVPEIGAPLSLIALALLVGGLVLSMTRQNARRQPNWRGRTIDPATTRADIWDMLKRRWENLRRRRGWNDSQWP